MLKKPLFEFTSQFKNRLSKIDHIHYSLIIICIEVKTHDISIRFPFM